MNLQASDWRTDCDVKKALPIDVKRRGRKGRKKFNLTINSHIGVESY